MEATETLTRGPGLRLIMSDAEVDRDTVEHVAGLARIDLSDAQIEQFRDEFAAILQYFDRLDEVPETDQPAGPDAELREDEVRESLSQSEALANAADTEDGYFKGPRVS